MTDLEFVLQEDNLQHHWWLRPTSSLEGPGPGWRLYEYQLWRDQVVVKKWCRTVQKPGLELRAAPMPVYVLEAWHRLPIVPELINLPEGNE